MTNLEQTFLESATRCSRESQSKGIDWEQRRYEIAKDILAAWCSNSDRAISLGMYDDKSAAAVRYADTLIKALKKK